VMVTREIRRALVGKQSEPASGAWMCHKDWSPNYTVGALAYDPWGRAIIGPIHCLVMNLGVRVSARIVPAKELQYRVEGEIRLVTTPTIDPSLSGLIMVREFGRINW